MDVLIEAIQQKNLALFHKNLELIDTEFNDPTPLMYAAQYDFFEAIPQLKKYEGRRVFSSDSPFPIGATALQIAAESGSFRSCGFLLKEAESCGFSVVCQAISCRDGPIMKQLLCKFKEAQFKTKLARAQGIFEGPQLGLSRAPQNDVFGLFKRIDSLGRSFLHYLSCWQNISPELTQIAEQYLIVGRDLSIHNMVDQEGNTCLHLAAINGNEWFCRQIKEKCPELLQQPANGKLTACMLAVENNNIELARMLSSGAVCAKALLPGNEAVYQLLEQKTDSQQQQEECHGSGDLSTGPRAHIAANSPTTESQASAPKSDCVIQQSGNKCDNLTQQQETRTSPSPKLDPGVLVEDQGPTLQELADRRQIASSLTDSLQISALHNAPSEPSAGLGDLAAENAMLRGKLQQAKADLQEVVAEYEKRLATLADLIRSKSDKEEQLTGIVHQLMQALVPK